MKPIDLVRFSLGAIIAHPMRSALTALGVVIGVAAVVMMTSIGLGAQQQVTSAISSLGSNLLVVTPGGGRGGGGFVSQAAGSDINLTGADAEAIRTQIDGVLAVSPSVRGGQQVVAQGANWNTRVEGVNQDYLTVRDLSLSTGRMFDEGETKQGKKVAVIGQTVADNLFGDADPLGQRIRIGAVPFEVVGLLASKGQSGFGQDQDDIVITPLQAARSRLFGRRVKGDSVQQIYVKATSEDALYAVQEDLSNLLRERHRIPAGGDDDFQVQNLASIMEAAQQTTQTFTILLAAVAGVSLAVGGVGIMNIMLVSVTERTREIGLRMAVGATRFNILTQFSLEAIALSLGGGLIGLAIGVGGAFIMAKVGGWPSAVPPWAAPLALGFSGIVGLCFGAYPAWRASKLDPIEALRRQ
jgi:putative ABC transport system permease protein